ncbi:MAG: hypothetical protein IPK04_14210 [Bdellovibrionales bacterium]|nr:hypothetical protein [Bdellovibrionales bacterium]
MNKRNLIILMMLFSFECLAQTTAQGKALKFEKIGEFQVSGMNSIEKLITTKADLDEFTGEAKSKISSNLVDFNTESILALGYYLGSYCGAVGFEYLKVHSISLDKSKLFVEIKLRYNDDCDATGSASGIFRIKAKVSKESQLAVRMLPR